MNKAVNVVAYIIVLVLSVLFLYCGNQYMTHNRGEGIAYNREEELDTLVFARVLSIDEIVGNATDASGKEIRFSAVIFGNEDKEDQLIHGKQIIGSGSQNGREITVGDKVVLLSYGDNYTFQYFYRFDKVVILGIVFTVFVLLLGGVKGFNTIVALALTCLAIFFVFIPSIGAGFNIYASTVGICLYIIVMTFTVIYGLSRKSMTAALSCIIGVLFSGALTAAMDSWMKLTGYINEDTYMMNALLGIEVNVKAIIFSMITIGALGSVMDVAMSITSSLCELKDNNKGLGPAALMKSGLIIGRDIMGTMANTLILAYIGSSLIVVLVYAASGYPLLSILNKEEIIFEFLQSLIGSFSLLVTIPLTAAISAAMLTKKEKKTLYKPVYRR